MNLQVPAVMAESLTLNLRKDILKSADAFMLKKFYMFRCENKNKKSLSPNNLSLFDLITRKLVCSHPPVPGSASLLEGFFVPLHPAI
jgi:hypothetical protein